MKKLALALLLSIPAINFADQNCSESGCPMETQTQEQAPEQKKQEEIIELISNLNDEEKVLWQEFVKNLEKNLNQAIDQVIINAREEAKSNQRLELILNKVFSSSLKFSFEYSIK